MDRGHPSKTEQPKLKCVGLEHNKQHAPHRQATQRASSRCWRAKVQNPPKPSGSIFPPCRRTSRAARDTQSHGDIADLLKQPECWSEHGYNRGDFPPPSHSPKDSESTRNRENNQANKTWSAATAASTIP